MKSLCVREVACSASDLQGFNFESFVWRAVSSYSSHHPQEVLMAQFSLYVHKRLGLKPDSFYFVTIIKRCNNHLALYALIIICCCNHHLPLFNRHNYRCNHHLALQSSFSFLSSSDFEIKPAEVKSSTRTARYTVTQCCFNVEPLFATLAQYWANIQWQSIVFSVWSPLTL